MFWQYRPLPARLVLHKGCFCSLLNSAFCRNLVPRLGAWVTHFPEVYEYLVDSILNFPGHKEIKHLLEETGFTNVRCHRLKNGIVCLDIDTNRLSKQATKQTWARG